MPDYLRTIKVIPYDSSWPKRFDTEASCIKKVITEGLVEIHHIGSTSVPALPAKPIIDLMLEVQNISILDTFDKDMEKLGYLVKGEFGIFGRRFYLKGQTDRTHHVHAFQTGSIDIERHLAVRDYLRSHSKEAAHYAELKIHLAQQFPHDNDGYCDGKDEYMKKLELRSLKWKQSNTVT